METLDHRDASMPAWAASSWSLLEEERWRLAQRIVASPSFSRSVLLSRFLLYVCEREITGRTGEITEHQIGVQVFGRKPGYHPGEDNIVRNYARQLRLRLDQYFQGEGRDEELRLTIPRGGYIPVFTANRFQEGPRLLVQEEQRVLAAPVDPLAVAAKHGAPQYKPPQHKFRYVWQCVAVLCVLGAAVAVWAYTRRAPVPARDVLWGQLFDKSRQTLIVPSDDGIVMIQHLTGHLVPLSEYINRDYLALRNPYRIDDQNMKALDAEPFTNITDLNTALRLSHLPEASSGNFVVRYARELHMEDLKNANVILLGSRFSNPWAELFEKSMNFQFSYQPRPNDSRIVNRAPQGGELPVYANESQSPTHRTYAVIGLVPNLGDSGWVLLAEGLTLAGTQAAVDTLLNPTVMQPLLEKFKNPNGALNPFEILLETRSFGSETPQASVIATRVYHSHP